MVVGNARGATTTLVIYSSLSNYEFFLPRCQMEGHHEKLCSFVSMSTHLTIIMKSVDQVEKERFTVLEIHV